MTEPFDIAVIGGGPAGTQAALVVARARKRVVLFDEPAPPRNAASHGVHNLLGHDGLLPAEIRELSWKQIDVYGYAEKRREEVERVLWAEGGGFEVRSTARSLLVRRVIAAFGYRDRHPEIEGFDACWARTIIPCPFCDGFENADRVWGVVPDSAARLKKFAALAPNWASQVRLIVPREIELTEQEAAAYRRHGFELSRGEIRRLEHTDGDLEAVILDSGERIPLGTLLWQPPSSPAPLLGRLVDDLGLELDKAGAVVANEHQETNVPGLYVAGDLQGWAGAVAAAAAADVAASRIVETWSARD